MKPIRNSPSQSKNIVWWIGKKLEQQRDEKNKKNGCEKDEKENAEELRGLFKKCSEGFLKIDNCFDKSGSNEQVAHSIKHQWTQRGL